MAMTTTYYSPQKEHWNKKFTIKTDMPPNWVCTSHGWGVYLSPCSPLTSTIVYCGARWWYLLSNNGRGENKCFMSGPHYGTTTPRAVSPLNVFYLMEENI